MNTREAKLSAASRCPGGNAGGPSRQIPSSMRVARWHAGAAELAIETAPVPTPTAAQVLVKVAAAGVCHSDLNIIDGTWPANPPLTLGHEVTGWIAASGPQANIARDGTPVIVMPARGCGACRACTNGHEKLCSDVTVAGVHRDGGFAEYLLVDHARQLVELAPLDPVQAAPLGCAGVIAYAATRRALDQLRPGATVAVIGTGGLGQFAVQLVRLMGAGAVIGVDRDPAKRRLAVSLGADDAVSQAGEASGCAAGLVGRMGVDAVIDFVGASETLEAARSIVAPAGRLVVVGHGGGRLSWSFDALAPEASLTTLFAANVSDLVDVVALARAGRLQTHSTRYELSDVNEALAALRAGRVESRAVLTL